MKNICINAITLITAINVVLLTACSDDNENPQLSVNTTELTFTANETQTRTVEITTTANFWVVEKSDDWVRYSKSGNKLFISVLNHTNTVEKRTATVIVTTADGQSVNITVTQEAKVPNTLSVNQTSLSYDANEIGDRTVIVTTDAESWEATTNAAWVTLVKQNNSLNVSVFEDNTKPISRIANIKITAGDAHEVALVVTQAAVVSLNVDADSLFFKADAMEEQIVNISTNAEKWDASTGLSWVKLIKQNNMLKVIVTEKNALQSPRNGDVKITADKAPDFILSVTQLADTQQDDSEPEPQI
jgi:hypothetical protein